MKSFLCILSLHLFSLSCLNAADKPLRVFILAGQSNMQGHAHVRTIEHLGMDEATVPLFRKMQNPDGTFPVCERVWISSIGSSEEEKIGKLTAGFGTEARGPKIGPEYLFGIRMEELIDGPILIIKTAWGGKSLNTDFRPPSAGPYEFNEKQLENFAKQGKDIEAIRKEKKEATGHYYRLMMEHVKKVLSDIPRVCPEYDEKAGYEVAGFVWFQGWNDMVDSGTYPDRYEEGGYDAYSDAMAHFIRDVRNDLGTPGLPFVIGVLGVNGPVSEYGPSQQRYRGVHQNFRSAMSEPAQRPEFKGNVAAVLTENYWDRELTELQTREQEIRQEVKEKVKQGEIPKNEERAAFEKLREEKLSGEERKILETGISNAGFHYLGSAKIMAGIGQAFADAMAELMNR